MMRVIALSCILCFLISISLCRSAGAGEVYGLVVGISDYIGTRNDLRGAVNDANDITEAMNLAGAKKVIRIIDSDATKKNIEESWNRLVDEAKAGDTIIFTYAGHGSQEPEPPGRGGEEDGMNENFLLAKFSPSGEGTRERIVDDEIFVWFERADKKDINVVFVADSCHSGSMHRTINNKNLTVRKGNFRNIESDQLHYPPPETAKLSVTQLKNITYVGATSDDRVTPEIQINGQWRGALSWAFARAIQGAADRNHDGSVDQLELLTYVVPAVKAHVESQQTPQIQPLRAKPRSLFSVKTTAVAMRSDDITLFGGMRSADFGDMKVAVLNANKAALKDVPFIDIVQDKNEAEITWDGLKGTVEHSIGGTVAEYVTPDSVVYVLTKWVALRWLKERMALDPISAYLPTGDQRYRKNQIVELEISGARYPHLTLFNLAPNGRVEFFIPSPLKPSEATKDWSQKPFRHRFRVAKPPYGAEHLVAIYSKDILADLHSALASMKTAEGSAAIPTVLRELLKGREYQVGVVDIYTSN